MDWQSTDAAPDPRRHLTAALVLLLGVTAVGFFVRSPVTAPPDQLAVDDAPSETGSPLESPLQSATETHGEMPGSGPPSQHVDALLGLDDVLPVVDGMWHQVPIEVDGQIVAPGSLPLSTTWLRDEVITISGASVSAYGPATGRWRRLPPLPSGNEAGVTRQVVAVGGGLMVIERQRYHPGAGPEVAVTAAWWLHNDRWTVVPDIPGPVLGTFDDIAVVGRYGGGWQAGQSYSGLSTLDPASGTVVDLPPTPVPVEPIHAEEVPDGFVLLCYRIEGGLGTPEDPRLFAPAALIWLSSTQRWAVLPDPPGIAEDAVWVPDRDGWTGRLVAFGVRTDDGPARPVGMLLDLDRGVWELPLDLPVSHDGDPRPGYAHLAVAWDGSVTVWAYGGHPNPVHIALHLPSGRLAVANPTGPRTSAELVWYDGQLFLFGGFGARGPTRTVEVWTPSAAATVGSATPADSNQNG